MMIIHRRSNRSFSSSSFSKRGQMEIIGLVFIVVLITLGMLFLALFALKQDTQKKIFTRKGLAYSTVGALMKTTVRGDAGCVPAYVGEASLQLGKDILEDCARHHPRSTYPRSTYFCQSQHSCDFAHDEMARLLNSTLGKWRKRYEFKAILIRSTAAEPEELISLKSGNGCPATIERDSSGLFPINTEAGLVESVLYLCE